MKELPKAIGTCFSPNSKCNILTDLVTQKSTLKSSRRDHDDLADCIDEVKQLDQPI